MTSRLTFLSHFVLCLAVSGIAFFAWINGVPQFVYSNDESMMTSVIAVVFLISVLHLGRQAWVVDQFSIQDRQNGGWKRPQVAADLGHLTERLAVMAGFVGTAIGLSMQATALANGSTSFGALATSLFTTASGGTAAALIAIMTFNLEVGVRRAQR
jgi:hypothetical protein